MKLTLLVVGKTRSAYIDAGVRDYLRRLGRQMAVEVRTARELKGRGADEARVRREETARLLALCPPGARQVVLDPRGRSMTSEEFSRLLSRWEMEGVGRAAFLIGGFAGLDPDQLRQAHLRLSLSPLTFTHEMARLILAEQLYRACCIKNGHPYHR